MKIVAISDTHGNLPVIPECDILIHAGDICPAYDHGITFQKMWLNGELGNFRYWLEEIPAKHKIFIAGNHDFIFDKAPYLVPKDFNWTYLQDEEIVIDGIKIYGSPWQPWFHDWAFNLHENELKKIWQEIPTDVDILVTHGPAYGYVDQVNEYSSSLGYYKGEHLGSKSLNERIFEVKPKLHICGHIHTGHGIEIEKSEDPPIWFANVSMLDEAYRMVYEPTIFEDDLF